MQYARSTVSEMSDLPLSDAQLADLILEVIAASTRLASEIQQGSRPSAALKRSTRPSGSSRRRSLLATPSHAGDAAWQRPTGKPIEWSNCSYFSTFKPLVNSANPLVIIQYKTGSECIVQYEDKVESFADGSQCYRITFKDRHHGAFGHESLSLKLTVWLQDGRIVAQHVDRELKYSGIRPEYRCRNSGKAERDCGCIECLLRRGFGLRRP